MTKRGDEAVMVGCCHALRALAGAACVKTFRHAQEVLIFAPSEADLPRDPTPLSWGNADRGGRLPKTTLPDGLTALRMEMQLSEIMRLIERTARWVDPDTFRLLPLWYPEHARRSHFYKKNWSEPQLNKNRQTGVIEHKREGNVHANKALTHALGLRSDDRPNWSCCHLWGVDDALYQESNIVVQDHRFFSCVANMVLLPTPLKAFTDTMREVKAMLRICARYLYGWHCEHESMADAIAIINEWNDWDAYPESWPNPERKAIPLGIVNLDAGIRQSAMRRLAQIRADIEHAGSHYPREKVREALDYWKIVL